MNKTQSRTKEPNHQPSEYLHIRAWGKMMGSYEYYISNQQAQASSDNAPFNAIYHREGEGWHIAEDIKNPATKEYIEHVVEELKRRRTRK